MRSDDLDFKLTTLTIRWGAAQGAEWWRSRPAHNPQRSNGAGPPCHPRTPPKAAQPTAQVRAAVQTMLAAKRDVGTTCGPHTAKRRWRVASARSLNRNAMGSPAAAQHCAVKLPMAQKVLGGAASTQGRRAPMSRREARELNHDCEPVPERSRVMM